MALIGGSSATSDSRSAVLGDLRTAVHPDAGHTATVGDVTLYTHQREAVALVLPVLRRYGGALLADAVGTGKTWSALGVATYYARLLVVAPAGLRPMWAAALARAGRSAPIATFESLSRGQRPLGPFDLVIVDEAHHARNPATRRFDALAAITWGADLLLLTATPLHNRANDLRALCSLFLGSGAESLEPHLLSRLICRRVLSGDAVPLPRVRAPRWLPVPDTSDTLQHILALPPPVPPSDGSSAAALGTYVLVRQWCSSDGALVAALDRRLLAGAAMAHRLSQGRVPTRRELMGWMADAGAVQLTLPLDSARPPTGAEMLASRLDLHLTAVRTLRDTVRADPTRDEQRCAALLEALLTQAGKRAVLFTHSVDTARMWFRRLSPRLRVACLDGHGGRITTGRLPREEIIRSFRPRAKTDRDASPRNDDPMRIDVLIATDVLSEGVDLHDAAVVVHLDLPWTVARFDQRVGRLRRIGSPHTEVRQYAFRPPAAGDGVLRLLGRLAEKAGLVDALVGFNAERFVEASGADVLHTPAPADARDALRELTREWTAPVQAAATEPLLPRAAAVRAADGQSGFLAAVALGGERCLVGKRDGNVTTDPAHLVRLVRSVTQDDIPVPTDTANHAYALVNAWLESELARSALLSEAAARSDAHRGVLRALNASLRNARRTARHDFLREITALRSVVLDSTGIGAEQAMIAWLSSHACPTADSLRALATALRSRARSRAVVVGNARITALLLLIPG